MSFSILGLLLLSLPIVSSLNFFAGFPLRLGISHIVAFLLSISGFSVELAGTMLSANGQVINIDAPCAGIHFLWFSAYFGLLLAYREQASFRRTLVLLFISGTGAIAGNVFRSLILSLLYLSGFASIADNPCVHEGLGAACFALTAMLILLATRLSYKHHKSPAKTVTPLETTDEIRSTYPWHLKLPATIYCLLCVVAASAPLVQARSVDAALAIKPDQWHDRAKQCNLKRIPLTAMEKQFQSRFPGDIAKFSDGQSEVIFRTIKSPTRQLHPAEDCLRGSGYILSKDSLTKDEHGVLWHTIQAQRGDKNFKVSERIIDHHGQSWLRVSDWYWAAVVGQTKGPWMSITKMCPISKG
jgi:exosortase/archaeosortase family protein